MIELVFEFAGDMALVVVRGNTVQFIQNGIVADISGVKLNYKGVIKEFPDLEGVVDWKQEAIKRFKEVIKSYETENDKANYIISDLKKHGYKCKYKQQAGVRRRIMNG